MDQPGVARHRARWTLPALVASALVLALVVGVGPDPLPGEIGYVRWLQGLGGPVPEVAELVRVTTGTEAALIVLALGAPWLVWRYRAAGAIAIALLLGTMLVVQPALKDIVDRPRPTADQVDVRAEHASESFPSGHSMSTTAVWGTVAALAFQRRRIGLAVAASVPIVITFVASGVQGVHWPTDAIGGTLLGAASARATVAVLRRCREPARLMPL